MKFAVASILALAAGAAAVPAPKFTNGQVIVVGWGPYAASVTYDHGTFVGAGASSPFGAASAGANNGPSASATATASSPFGSAGAGAGINPPGASASAGSPFGGHGTKGSSVSVTTKPKPTKKA
ncbi:hypothetical protein OC845_005366 [Tilletia horrida]|nr:hypothetical protein OC845_005366 [Tilletia horrida]